MLGTFGNAISFMRRQSNDIQTYVNAAMKSIILYDNSKTSKKNKIDFKKKRENGEHNKRQAGLKQV